MVLGEIHWLLLKSVEFHAELGETTTAGAGAANPPSVSESNCHHGSGLPTAAWFCPVLMEVLGTPAGHAIVGVAVGVNVGVAVRNLNVSVAVGVGVAVRVGVAVGVTVLVAVAVTVGVAVSVGVAVGVTVLVAVGVTVLVAVAVTVGVAVSVGVAVGVGEVSLNAAMTAPLPLLVDQLNEGLKLPVAEAS